MAIKFFSGIDLSNVTAGSILKVDSNGVIVAAVDGTDYNTASADSWSDVGSNIYRNSDVRIGTYQSGVAPAARLHVFDYQSTDVKLLIEDGNTGDASMQFKVSAQSYVMGLDNSDSDRFKLSVGTAFGSTGLTMKPTGQLGINGLPNGDLDVISSATPTLFVRTSAVSSQDAIVRIQGSRTTSTTSEIAQIRFETVDSDSSGNELARISALKDTASTNVGRLEFFTMPTNGGTLSSRMTIKSDGDVGIGTTSPSAKLDVNGDIEANGNITAQSSSYVRLRVDQTDSGMIDMGLTSGSADGFLNIQNTGSGHVTDDPEFKLLLNSSEKLRVDSSGNLGIGTDSPAYKLHVEGNVGITEYLQHKGDNNTYLRFSTDLIRLAAGGVEMIRLLEDSTQDAVIINEGGADVDFRVESDADTHALFLQASDGNFGIGTSSPAAKLHVDGSVRFEDLTSGILKVDADGDLSVDTNTYSTASGVADNADNYGSWTVSDGTNTEAVTSGTTIAWRGSGATSVSYDASTNQFNISSTDNNTTYNNATTSTAGLMSATDKTKLDGVATNATANAGTVTNVTVGTGLDVANGGTTPNITLDLSELSDMTAAINTSQDELILLDNGAERRKLFSEIFGSAAYSNTSAFAAASHNHDSSYPAKTDSYISLFSDSWGNTPEGKYIQVDLPYRSGSGSSAYYVFDVFGFRDIGQMDSMVNYRVYAHTRSNGTETNDVKFRVYALHENSGEFFEFAYKTQTGSATQFFVYIEEDYSGAEIFGLPLDQGEFAGLTSAMISSSDTAPSGTTQVTAEVAHPTVNTTAGTYGSTANGTKIDQITIDANGHITNISTGATGNMTGFFVEDGDGTEVQITNAKEWKFVEGTGIDINWTDTSNGSDADPYDLTFAVKNNSIGIDQLNVTDGSNGQVLTTNGSGTLSFGSVLSSVNSDVYRSSTYSTDSFLKLHSTETLYTGVTLGSIGGVGIILDTNNNDAAGFYIRHGTADIDTATNLLSLDQSGNLEIVGNLEATAKSFNIEHPTKEGKRLVYGSLEGAEHGVYFRGKGAGGVIELPDHWTGLVHEDSITVQLTPIGKNCVWVEDIKDNSVHVGMDNDTPYFYFIQAERKDIDKLIVEQDA